MKKSSVLFGSAFRKTVIGSVILSCFLFSGIIVSGAVHTKRLSDYEDCLAAERVVVATENDIRIKQAVLGDSKLLLPSVLNQGELLEEITNKAIESGVTLSKMKGGEATEDRNHSFVDYDIGVSGDRKTIKAFLQKLDNMPFEYSVKEFNFQNTGDADNYYEAAAGKFALQLKFVAVQSLL